MINVQQRQQRTRHTSSNSLTRNYCCRAREVTLSFMDTLIGPTYLLTYLLTYSLTHLSGMGYHTVDDDVHRGMDSLVWNGLPHRGRRRAQRHGFQDMASQLADDQHHCRTSQELLSLAAVSVITT